MATTRLGLKQSTYAVTTGAVWTDNHEDNWNFLDSMYDYPLVHDGEILTFEGSMLFYIP